MVTQPTSSATRGPNRAATRASVHGVSSTTSCRTAARSRSGSVTPAPRASTSRVSSKCSRYGAPVGRRWSPCWPAANATAWPTAATTPAGNRSRSPASASGQECQAVNSSTGGGSAARRHRAVRPGERGAVVADVLVRADALEVVRVQGGHRRALRLRLAGGQPGELRAEDQAEGARLQAADLLHLDAGHFLLERVHLRQLGGGAVLDDGVSVAEAVGGVAGADDVETEVAQPGGGGAGDPDRARAVEHLELHLGRADRGRPLG